jgi:transcription elongation factor Elf1
MYNVITTKTKHLKGKSLLMDNIILYLLQIIQYQYKQICWLLNFICRYIPLKQWAFDDSHSPKYQNFKIDELPRVFCFKQEWTYKDLIPYFQKRYGKTIKPVNRRSECDIPEDCRCPRCGAPQIFLYKNNGSKGQVLCKVCDTKFSTNENRFSKNTSLRCPHCGHTLVPKKNRKHFIIHKCTNPKCSYYLHNLKKADKKDLQKEHSKSKYKLHYICREFTVDFFRMDLRSLPKNSSSLRFSKHNAHVMSLCLTNRWRITQEPQLL